MGWIGRCVPVIDVNGFRPSKDKKSSLIPEYCLLNYLFELVNGSSIWVFDIIGGLASYRSVLPEAGLFLSPTGLSWMCLE
jgi:hypothetical protein